MDPRLLNKIEKLFAPAERAEAERLVRECADSPLVGEGSNLLRTRAGVLKMSCGSLEKLRKSVAVAARDWRDVLVWSGFQNGAAADDWLNEP